MKKGWEIKELGSVCDVQRGLTYSGKDAVDFSSNVVLRATNINLGSSKIDLTELKYLRDDFEVKENYRLKLGSLLICFSSGSKSHLGKVALIDRDYEASFGGFIGQITPNDLIASKYLFYNLLSESYRAYITGLTDGVNINNLKAKDLKNFPIPIPPLSEQEEIVEVLDKAFAAIDQAKANIEQNIANAKELFQSKLNQIFSRKGEGWVETILGELCQFIRGPFGGSLKKNCFVESGYAVYEQQHAIYDQFEDIRYFIDETKFEEMKRFQLLPGDLIMSCSGTMGKVAVVPKNIQVGIINQALLKLTPSDALDVEYLRIWMTSNSFQLSLAEHTVGAAIKNVASVKILKQIKMPIPPIEEQKKIIAINHNFKESIESLISNYQTKLASLDELKKSILQKAFAGELT